MRNCEKYWPSKFPEVEILSCWTSLFFLHATCRDSISYKIWLSLQKKWSEQEKGLVNNLSVDEGKNAMFANQSLNSSNLQEALRHGTSFVFAIGLIISVEYINTETWSNGWRLC